MYKPFVERRPMTPGSLTTQDAGNLLEVTMAVSSEMALNAYMVQLRYADGTSRGLLMARMMEDTSGLKAVLGNPKAMRDLTAKCPKTLTAILAGLGKTFEAGSLTTLQGHVFLTIGIDISVLQGQDTVQYFSDVIMRLYKLYDEIREEMLNGSFDQCDETFRSFVSALLKSMGLD